MTNTFYGYQPSSRTIKPLTSATAKKSAKKGPRTYKGLSRCRNKSGSIKSDPSSQTLTSLWQGGPQKKTEHTAPKKATSWSSEIYLAAKAKGMTSKSSWKPSETVALIESNYEKNITASSPVIPGSVKITLETTNSVSSLSTLSSGGKKSCKRNSPEKQMTAK